MRTSTIARSGCSCRPPRQRDRVADLRHDLEAVSARTRASPSRSRTGRRRSRRARDLPDDARPPPAGVRDASRPPCASTRSASPRSPEPPAIGAAAAVVGDLDHELVVVPHGADPDGRASACLTAFASASQATKYAGASISGGSRSSSAPLDPHVERRASRQRLQRPAEPFLGQDRRMDAAGELAQLGDGDLQLADRPGENLLEIGVAGRRAGVGRASSSASATRRCWAPSWMSRSIRRRSSSPAATIRRRDSCTWSSCARTSAAAARSRARAARRRGGLEELRLVVERRVVDDNRDPLALVGDLRDRPRRTRPRERDGAPVASPYPPRSGSQKNARASDRRGRGPARHGSREAASGRARPPVHRRATARRARRRPTRSMIGSRI